MTNLFWQLADGSAPAERLTTSVRAQTPHSWSPDGKLLAFTESDATNGRDIWILPMDADRKPRPFLRDRSDESMPAFSPDGRWLAYSSDETGAPEVYVRAYPGPQGKFQISNHGGWAPVWARNGRELFYLSGAGLMSVTVTLGARFSATNPRVLVHPFPDILGYSVSRDGQRFAVVSHEPQAEAAEINLVLNWHEELKRLVPTK